MNLINRQGAANRTLAGGVVLLVLAGCSLHSQRLPYHPNASAESEGVWAELKRELATTKSNRQLRNSDSKASWFTKTSKTVKGWFVDRSTAAGPNVSPGDWKRINDEYNLQQRKPGIF